MMVGMTMPDDILAYNRKLIEEFRADGGKSMGDRPLLLLTTVGRRSGEARTSPMMYVPSGDRYLVIASNNGAAEDPQWFRNLTADPSVTVELAGDRFEARAEPLSGDDYEREWTAIKQGFPFFAEHETRAAGRRIPVVNLIRAS
jgi:deazaflavin-dependent oxidoreductase (nitroreductase family)